MGGLLFVLLIGAFWWAQAKAQAPNPHAGLTWTGPGTCLACHDQEAREVQNSVHYQWMGEVPFAVNGPALQGKLLTGVNSYCINILGNWNGCGNCHIGLGAKPAAEVTPAQLANIDCLICHHQDYKRVKVNGVFVPDPTLNMDTIAQTVHKPTRSTCLVCHATSGGSDNCKRGDLALAHKTTADRDFDVHMATAGANLNCQACHTTQNHRIAGRGSDLRQTDLNITMSCSTLTCHPGKASGTGHNNTYIDKHVARVACQTCHIRTFARNASDTTATEATEIYRNWTLPHLTASGAIHPTGTYANTIIPAYRFWSGYSYNYNLGEDAWIDPLTGKYPTSRPVGDINDPLSKLYPFKYKRSLQPLATRLNKLIALDTSVYFPNNGLDANTRLNNAVMAGLRNMAYNPAEGYAMVETDTYQLINHEVTPRAQALQCADCHGSTLQMNLPALGYVLKEAQATLCQTCHGSENPRDFYWMHDKHVTDEGEDCASCHNFTRLPQTLKAQTRLAGSVTSNSAVLNGIGNPAGVSTEVYFEWGTGTAYGTSTPRQSIGTGTNTVTVTAALTGLTPGRTYHFRLVAVDPQGNRYGYDYSFTTLRLYQTYLPQILNTVINGILAFFRLV